VLARKVKQNHPVEVRMSERDDPDLLANPLAPGFAGDCLMRVGVRPLHTARGSYGPADPRQGQADFVSTKNQCEYAALTRISRPKMFHDRCGGGRLCEDEFKERPGHRRRWCALIESREEKENADSREN
jgi:hypothetical protein